MSAARQRAVLALAAALAGCGSLGPVAAPPNTSSAGPAVGLRIDGRAHPGRWQPPAGEARGLVVLAPGFTRRCSHLAGTAEALVAVGLTSLCLDASMAGGGDPVLARALADRLLDGRDPAGRAWPARIIVAGHSAGAVFALRLGARLAERAPARLAGALLLDPVATADFGEVLAQVSDEGRRPVLALPAAPHRCNAQGNALPALQDAARRARAAGRDTLQLPEPGPGSTHADAEGEDSDWLAIAACGRPTPPRVAELRERAVAWALRVVEAAPGTVDSAVSSDAPSALTVP